QAELAGVGHIWVEGQPLGDGGAVVEAKRKFLAADDFRRAPRDVVLEKLLVVRRAAEEVQARALVSNGPIAHAAAEHVAQIERLELVKLQINEPKAKELVGDVEFIAAAAPDGVGGDHAAGLRTLQVGFGEDRGEVELD